MRRLALAVSVGLLATGCAAPDLSTRVTLPSGVSRAVAPDPVPAALLGARIQGTGYTYRVPKGWVEAGARLRKTSSLIESGAVSPSAEHGVTSSVSVIVLPWSGGSLDAAVDKGMPEIERRGVTAERGPNTWLDGTLGARFRVTVSARVVTRQVIAVHGDKLYVVSVSHGAKASAATVKREVGAVVTSWSWTS